MFYVFASCRIGQLLGLHPLMIFDSLRNFIVKYVFRVYIEGDVYVERLVFSWRDIVLAFTLATHLS